LQELRAEFPVCERVAYLNAGTSGPVPRLALTAVEAELRAQLELGRGDPRFYRERVVPRADELRRRVAALLGCAPGELALTGSTTDGVSVVLSALPLGPGDEVLTSDEEHPGLLAPLASGMAHRGFAVRAVPFAELPGEVGARTRLVACSHISWVTGRTADAAALARAGVPVLLDGAQALGAVPVDVRELGCDFYAASGQKWLCGPHGTGYLYVRPERIAELVPAWPGYGSLADPKEWLARALPEEPAAIARGFHADARRFDLGFPAPHQVAWALAGLDTLEAAGHEAVLERARSLAAGLARALHGRGVSVAPRGESTLVSWEVPEPEREAERLYAEGFVVRSIPGRQYVRAAVGAWNTEEELERLVALATSGSSR
jgi:L-cysteine/cystine lyase